jgi:hypothetical protein
VFDSDGNLYLIGRRCPQGLTHNNQIVTGCSLTDAETYTLLAQSILAILLLGFAMYICNSQPNTLGILSELRLALWLGGVPAVFFYALGIAIPEAGEFQFNMLIEYAFVLCAFFQSGYQVHFSLPSIR